MLEQLSTQLQSIQPVDAQRIVQSLTALQGTQTSEQTRVFALLAGGAPSVITKEVPDASGNLATSERSTSKAAATPTLPSLPEALTPPQFTPSFAPSAQDLLSDQVSLAYQIFNVRMLLEQALTDRLTETGEPRLRAVLGFQVALDPPKDKRDHAAYVEIALKGGHTGPLALVGAMPYEKSYNSFALSSKANAFGGSAVVKMLTLGYAEKHRSQVAYLFKDSDTLALGPMGDPAPGPDGTLRFGWVFRPVLGRRSVSPGIRQLFAVVALPVADKIAPEQLQATVRTYWRKYSHDLLATTASEKQPKEYALPPVWVYSSEYLDDKLAPQIEDVRCDLGQDGSAVVSVRGCNFFTGTRVLLGGNVYESGKGLILKSERTLELRTNPNDLATGEAVVSGRYGRPVLIRSTHPQWTTPGAGILVNAVQVDSSPGRSMTTVWVFIQDRSAPDSLRLVRGYQPLISVGGTIIPGPYDQEESRCPTKSSNVTGRDCVRYAVFVPTTLLRKETPLTVRFLFLPPAQWTANWLFWPAEPFSVAVLGGTPMAHLIVRGWGFDNRWMLSLDRTYGYGVAGARLMVSPSEMFLDVDSKTLAKYRRVVLRPPDDRPVIVLDLSPAEVQPVPDKAP